MRLETKPGVLIIRCNKTANDLVLDLNVDGKSVQEKMDTASKFFTEFKQIAKLEDIVCTTGKGNKDNVSLLVAAIILYSQKFEEDGIEVKLLAEGEKY